MKVCGLFPRGPTSRKPTLMMSSLSDSHSARAETSSTRPVTSTAMTLTGIATVRPVRMAVLMISVSCGEGGALLSRGDWGPLLLQDMPAKSPAPGYPHRSDVHPVPGGTCTYVQRGASTSLRYHLSGAARSTCRSGLQVLPHAAAGKQPFPSPCSALSPPTCSSGPTESRPTHWPGHPRCSWAGPRLPLASSRHHSRLTTPAFFLSPLLL